jgi:hypothetical protein
MVLVLDLDTPPMSFRSDSLMISGGNIHARGSDGAGIGTAVADLGFSRVSELVIVNGSFSLQASFPCPGIDSGPFSAGQETLRIMNGFFDCSAVNASFCFNSSALTFQDGSISAVTNYRTVASSSSSQMAGSPSLYFEYILDSSAEGLSGLPILHLGSISFPYATLYSLSVRQNNERGI